MSQTFVPTFLCKSFGQRLKNKQTLQPVILVSYHSTVCFQCEDLILKIQLAPQTLCHLILLSFWLSDLICVFSPFFSLLLLPKAILYSMRAPFTVTSHLFFPFFQMEIQQHMDPWGHKIILLFFIVCFTLLFIIIACPCFCLCLQVAFYSCSCCNAKKGYNDFIYMIKDWRHKLI